MRASKLSKIDIAVFTGLLLLAGVGLLSIFLGLLIGQTIEHRLIGQTIEHRLGLGGAMLFFGALFGCSGYLQLRYGITLVHDSWWSSRMRCVKKSERPMQYWFTTVLFSVGSVHAFVLSVLSFLGFGP
jgi:hypothetical protein